MTGRWKGFFAFSALFCGESSWILWPLEQNIRLQDLPALGDDEHPINWAHIGSPAEVNKRLSSVVAFLQGQYPAGKKTLAI